MRSRLLLVCMLLPLAADAADLPKRKSGQWEISTAQTGGPPGPVAQMCIDEKSDDLTRQLAAGAVTCSKQEIRREGNRYVAESVCKIGESTATTRTVISGDFASTYQADIERITIRTHESAIRIIDKKGPLDNPADRDHCIQYMVAVPLLFGRLTAADYEDNVAADPRIDALRARMVCVEDPQFTRDYLDPQKRSIANGITIEFRDGTRTKEVVVEYPIGHRRRRAEGMPVLVEKFRTNLARRFPPRQQAAILDVALDTKRLRATPVNEFVDLMVI